jgi:16S rRNA (guanine966-N2)-methyltransferase
VLRILGGKFRGRRLKSPAGRKTRPTSARVRESVFDILEHSPDTAVDWPDIEALDLYAGSGAYGLEAISRGATGATLVDRNPAAVAALKENVKRLGAGACCTVLGASVADALGQLESDGRKFGLVFLDPPYGEPSEGIGALDRIDKGAVLLPGGCVVIEGPARRPGGEQGDRKRDDDPFPGRFRSLNVVSRRRWGDTEVVFLRHV